MRWNRKYIGFVTVAGRVVSESATQLTPATKAPTLKMMKRVLFTRCLMGFLAAAWFGGDALLAEAAASQIPGAQPANLEKAIFAGGCFWCVQPPFEKLMGVMKVVAGYTGGTGMNPTYEDYAQKGHIEAVEIAYDPGRISYSQLLDVLWRQINPTDGGGQFVDRGPQYRSAIFYLNDEQKQLAQKSKEQLAKTARYDKPIVTEILPASTFYPAEQYHQDYYKKNPIRYSYYRSRSGRDAYLDKTWGKDRELVLVETAGASSEFRTYSKPELKKKLTPLQYKVTQEDATEPPFANAYWNNEHPGIYVDIVSGEPLFSSLDKFDSGTGWPSFTKPLEPGNVIVKEERGFFSTRTEVRSKHANSHLGDLFKDGPKPTGLRYCLDSAALQFIPKEDLQRQGFAQYAKLFEKTPEIPNGRNTK